MRKLNTREILMLVALGVTAVVVWFMTRGDGFGSAGSASGTGTEVSAYGEAPVVRMDLLARRAEAYDPEGRDLFKYYVPPKPPPPPPPPPKERPKPVPVKTAPAPPPPTPRPPVERLPTPEFTYIGNIGPKDARLAVFELGEEVILAGIGDTVQERFEVVEFKYEAVVMGFTEQRYKGKTTELTLPK